VLERMNELTDGTVCLDARRHAGGNRSISGMPGHTPRLLKEVIMKAANRFSVIAGVLAAVICSSALEAAAQQQPIFGCIKPGTGLLRIPPPNEGCKAGETPLGFNDLPLLVGLRNQVEQLQTEVDTLQANGVGAGIVAARIVGLPSQHGNPEDRFGAISGTSDQSLDTGSVAMLAAGRWWPGICP
jgi:hypothetical protein